jgi:outer membrane protein assembly factor BamD (BamD/ComL family)
MSVTGISGSGFYSALPSASIKSKFQQLQQEFQQVGQDLRSGNLKQAQSDFATLQQNLPNQGQSTASTTQSANPLSQAVTQLGQDLQSGNLTAAQSDFATLQQDIQQQQSTGQAAHHHRHHRVSSSQDSDSSQQSGISSLFSQLGQELQTGNVTQAQQTYSTLQQDFQQFAANNGFGATATTGTGSATSSGGLNVSA